MVVDIFSGLGGWDLATLELGLDVVGVEIDEWACKTRDAAGLVTIRSDVELLDPMLFAGAVGFIASPPCQGFSTAGKQDPNDPRNRFVWEMQRWITAIRPQWIAFEQVPPVLRIWEAYATWLGLLGYYTWTGCLHAEQHGVPQTRKRAILMASLRPFNAPPPTHSKYYPRDPQRFDDGVEPWISMAEALGWDELEVRSSQSVAGGDRAIRESRDPALTIGQNVDRWIIRTRGDRKTSGGNLFSPSTPERALTEKTRSWTVERPAPTLVTSPRSDEGLIVGRQLDEGEERDPRHGGWTLARSRPAPTDRRGGTATGGPEPFANRKMRDQIGSGVRITLEEALILQGFPPDYPVQGVKSRKFLQVGNAIPPPLALAILTQLHHPS